MRYYLLITALLLNTVLYSQYGISNYDIPEYSLQPNNSDLSFLDTELKDIQILGIGESTHGTKEFNLVYFKMFKYLVEQHNFNTLFLEDEFVPCSLLDAYVKCENNCDSLTTAVLSYWCWSTQEMNYLIQWIRDYNRSHRSNKLSIVGTDIQDSKSICTELNALLKKSKIDTIVLPEVIEITNEAQIDKYRMSFSSKANIDAYRSKLHLIHKNQVEPYSRLLEYLNWNNIVSSNPKRRH